MKRCKKYISMLFLIMGVCLCLSLQTFAAERSDSNPENRLHLSYQDEGKALSGAKFSLYLIATTDEYGELTLTDDFSKYPIQIPSESDAGWNALASTLESYVLRDKVSSVDNSKTDQKGNLSFPTGSNKLENGLYLVLGTRLTQGGYLYDAQPFLVMLPTADISLNAWIYDMNVNPKYDKRKAPVSPEDAKITRKVLKIWKDDGNEEERPDEIVIHLLRDGKVYDTVYLSEKNQWRYIWKNLDASHTWTVAEMELEDYSVEIVREGITFVVTNTLKKSPSSHSNRLGSEHHTSSGTKLPQTGQLWWPVPFLFAVGMALVMMGVLQQRIGENE